MVIRVERTLTMANSAATKNPFRRTSASTKNRLNTVAMMVSNGGSSQPRPVSVLEAFDRRRSCNLDGVDRAGFFYEFPHSTGLLQEKLEAEGGDSEIDHQGEDIAEGGDQGSGSDGRV